jgi:MSHA biogenesis protein MshL
MRRGHVLLLTGCALLSACGTQPLIPSKQHIMRESAKAPANAAIPPLVKRSIPLPPPKPSPKLETYSVVVTNVPAQQILFALARDAKVNLDIYPGIQGNVTINAINQTLPQILDRISKQIDMRYELDGPNLEVMPDTPYLRQYKINYVNMIRDTEGGISNSTQVGSSVVVGAGQASTGNNNSQLTIKDVSHNRFWDTLVKNIKDILHETDKILPAGSSETVVQQSNAISTTGTGIQQTSRKKGSRGGIENSPNPASLQEGATTVTRTSTFREAASVIANPETGIITVRATAKQHAKIQQFIDQVMASARRQVLIEVTVAEVNLNKNYQQGINWNALPLGGKGFSIAMPGTTNLPTTANAASLLVLSYNNAASKFGNLSAALSLLDSFGDVRVLSSPTLSVMNNQTAMLRVVDNLVYFTVESSTSQAANTTSLTTFTTTPHSVPVGLTMSITPQISDSDTVQIDVRPSITRLLATVPDPNPLLANPCGFGVPNCNVPAITSSIPEVQTREMESVLTIDNNQIAVLGGLMQDEINNLTDAIPGISNIPLAGELFKHRNDTTKKTELVIFLRPTVIKDASMNGDFGEFRDTLPDRNFFKANPEQSSSNAR